jgi:UDP-N-acetylglucosamine 2-epimerase
MLGFPAVTIRNSMERPEALDAGSIMICGLDGDAVLAAIATQIEQPNTAVAPAEYLVSNTAERVEKLIVGTSGLAARWDNLLVRER